MSVVARRLFAAINAPDPDCQYNASVTRADPVCQWGDYADGYRAVADAAFKHALYEHPTDIVVYPVLFCYRQYVELKLKELIVIGSNLIDQSLTLPSVHDLSQLWSVVRPLLERIRPQPGTHEEFDRIDSVLGGFMKVDPKSMAFRYPVDRQGNSSLPEWDIVNLKRVHQAIAEIAPILEGLSTILFEYLAEHREAMADQCHQDLFYAEPVE